MNECDEWSRNEIWMTIMYEWRNESNENECDRNDMNGIATKINKVRTSWLHEWDMNEIGMRWIYEWIGFDWDKLDTNQLKLWMNEIEIRWMRNEWDVCINECAKWDKN